jgi:hypothetical protein
MELDSKFCGKEVELLSKYDLGVCLKIHGMRLLWKNDTRVQKQQFMSLYVGILIINDGIFQRNKSVQFPQASKSTLH